MTGRVAGTAAEIRPPWALGESRFTDACSRCGDCMRACPEQIVVAGAAGFPRVDFARGGCTFCGACEQACRPRALARSPGVPWRLESRLSTAACLGTAGIECRVCADWCDVRAIVFRPGAQPSAPRIDNGVCTACGACVAPCPTGALSMGEKGTSDA